CRRVKERAALLRHLETLKTQLKGDARTRYDRLEQSRDMISRNAPSEEPWFREVLSKLDHLLEKFLQFAQSKEQFRQYMRSLLQDTLREEAANQPMDPQSLVRSRSAQARWQGEPPTEPVEAWADVVTKEVVK